MRTTEPSQVLPGRALLLLAVLLAAGILAAGAVYYRSFVRHYRASVEQSLSAIAELKVSELAGWRQERLGDGSLLFQNPEITALVRRVLGEPADADARRQLGFWFSKYHDHYQYDQLRLLDAQGVTRLSLPAELGPAAAAVVRSAAETLRSGQVALQDFYLDDSARSRLAVLVPILDAADANPPLGVLVLRVDPATHLYPFIRRWPTPSPTAETLLVRREGDDVVFLNELRFQPRSSLWLRAPLTSVTMPAVQAVLGREGIMEGIDYRGVPVVSALRSIPGSPWALVACIDLAEIYLPVRQRLWGVIALTTLLLLGAAAGVALAWRQQSLRAYQSQARVSVALRASELRYRRLFEAARDGILILDAETGMVVDVNPFLVELLGVTREVFLGKRVWELGFLRDVVANEANFTELQQKGYVRYEDMALEGHDGTRHEVEFVSNVYLVDHQKVIQCNIRDITERKQAEAELAATKAILRAALDHSQAGIAIADAPSGTLRYVNQAALLIGGGTEAGLVAGVDVNRYVASWKLFSLDRTPLAPEEVPLARAVLFGEPCTREFIIRRSALDDRIVLANAAPIRNPAGEVTAGIVVFLDVTEQKRAEEQLRQKTEDLRASNEELTRFNRLMAGRELRAIELKQQVNDLAAQLGQSRPYPLAFLDAAAAEVVRTTPKPGEQDAKILESPKGTAP
jgi:PAS domain S-box-containing protein